MAAGGNDGGVPVGGRAAEGHPPAVAVLCGDGVVAVATAGRPPPPALTGTFCSSSPPLLSPPHPLATLPPPPSRTAPFCHVPRRRPAPLCLGRGRVSAAGTRGGAGGRYKLWGLGRRCGWGRRVTAARSRAVLPPRPPSSPPFFIYYRARGKGGQGKVRGSVPLHPAPPPPLPCVPLVHNRAACRRDALRNGGTPSSRKTERGNAGGWGRGGGKPPSQPAATLGGAVGERKRWPGQERDFFGGRRAAQSCFFFLRPQPRPPGRVGRPRWRRCPARAATARPRKRIPLR